MGTIDKRVRSESFRRSLVELDVDTLIRLDEALDDSPHGDCGLALDVIDEIWKRWGRPVDEWPVAQIAVDGGPPLSIVNFCGRASSPDDPEHRPSMRIPPTSEIMLAWCKLHDIEEGGAREEYRCSCGQRGWEAIGKRRRVEHSPFFWPTLGTLRTCNAVHAEFYVVCPHARSADDLEHAPWRIYYRNGDDKAHGHGDVTCICNAHYGVLDDGGEGDMYHRPPKRMPTF